MSLLVPTPPVSPRRAQPTADGTGASRTSTPRSGHASAASSPAHGSRHIGGGGGGSNSGSRRQSINVARRQSLLVESQLNALIFPPKAAHDTDADKSDGLDSHVKPAVASAAVDPRDHRSAGSVSAGLEPHGSYALPISKPLSQAAMRVRRNSWVQRDEISSGDGDGSGATVAPRKSASAAVPIETTPVQSLRPGALLADEAREGEASGNAEASPVQETLLTGPLSRDGAHPLFATPAAAAQYSRMLRRASWPLLVPDVDQLVGDAAAPAAPKAQHDANDAPTAAPAPLSSRSHPASYHPTPACSTRRLAMRRPSNEQQDLSEEGSFDFTSSTADLSFNADFAPAASSNATPAPAQVPAPVPAPLVNLLLLGDESCGLGVALDEFAGRDRNVGITFKTRKISLRRKQPRADAADASSRGGAGAAEVEEETYRVRCWHTPGLTPSTALNLAPYLRRVQAIALVYDVCDRNSFHACCEWADRLVAHLEARAESGHAQARDVPLVLLANEAMLKSRSSATAAARKSEELAASDQGAANAPAPAASRSVTRRSSLSHAYLPTNPVPDMSGSSSSSHVSAVSAAASAVASAAGDVASGRAVSASEEAALSARLGSQYGGRFGPVASLSLNAHLWRDRYRAFHRVAALVQQVGTAQQHSRPVSPVHAGSAAHSRNQSPSRT